MSVEEDFKHFKSRHGKSYKVQINRSADGLKRILSIKALYGSIEIFDIEPKAARTQLQLDIVAFVQTLDTVWDDNILVE